MISTLMITTLIISTHLVSTLTIPTLTILELVISTLTIAWALCLGAFAPKPGGYFRAPRRPPFKRGLWGAMVRLQ
jgi:hypothetical protein